MGMWVAAMQKEASKSYTAWVPNGARKVKKADDQNLVQH